MRKAILVVALAVGMGTANTARALILGPALAQATRTRPPAIALVWFDPRQVLPWGGEETRREVTAILGSAGAEVRWRIATETPETNEVVLTEIPVVLLPYYPDANPLRARVMGGVEPRHEPPRTVWVFVLAVKETLGLGREGLWPSQPYLPLALSRVIAHEVLHAVAPANPHSSGGLMAESLGRPFLVGPRQRFDAACVEAFRGGLAQLALNGRQAEASSQAPDRR